MKEFEVPDEICGCPEKRDGSIPFALAIGLLASLIPVFYALFSVYGFSLDALTNIPDAYYLQAGIYLKYFASSDNLLMYICLILVGVIVGSMSGGIGKTILASALFFVIYLISFVLLGLLFLGQEIDFSKFVALLSFDFLVELFFVMIPAILISLKLAKRTKTSRLPYKVTIIKPKLKIKKDENEYDYIL